MGIKIKGMGYPGDLIFIPVLICNANFTRFRHSDENRFSFYPQTFNPRS
jgi:hypothetical protein